MTINADCGITGIAVGTWSMPEDEVAFYDEERRIADVVEDTSERNN